jgi:hypothetical protein
MRFNLGKSFAQESYYLILRSLLKLGVCRVSIPSLAH